MKRFAFLAVLAAAAGLVFSGCQNSSGSKVKLAFVANNVSNFWTICRLGAEQAVKEQPNIDLDFRLNPDKTAAGQKQIVQDLLAKGIQGIAISPYDPANQGDLLNSVVDQKAVLVTSDSDAPNSKRVCYIGADNEAAGEQAGQEIVKALPDGGKIMLFVGDMGAQNAIDRIAGIKTAIKDSKVSIIDVRTDGANTQNAKNNADDTITKYPDIAMLVGIYDYNGPAIVNAVTGANKIGKIKVVCFDYQDATLKGIKDGVVTSTIVQNPFEFGHQSMLFMYKYVTQTDHSFVPASKKIIIPTRVINKDNVDAFQADLEAKTGK